MIFSMKERTLAENATRRYMNLTLNFTRAAAGQALTGKLKARLKEFRIRTEKGSRSFAPIATPILVMFLKENNTHQKTPDTALIPFP